MVKLSVIIPVYNAPDDVRSCLDSLEKHFDFSTGEVIVVDDCSKPETAGLLDQRSGKFIVLHNPENLGFVGSCNRGMAAAKGDIFVLLNSDTLIPAGFCSRIFDCFASDEKIGVASPIASSSGSYFIPLYDGETLETMDAKIKERTPVYPEIPTAEGFCFCLRRSVFEALNGLDTIYGRGYNEERDFSFRARKAGKRCVLIDNLYVFHKRHASFTSAERKAQLQRNNDIFRGRWGDWVKDEKDRVKHRNPVEALRIQLYPKYFKKNLFYSKVTLPEKTIYRLFGLKITFKKK